MYDVKCIRQKGNSQEEKNKTVIRSFIDEIFNKYDLSSVEKYFGKDSVEGSPQAGKAGEGFKQFLTEFSKAFPDMHTTTEHIVCIKRSRSSVSKESGMHEALYYLDGITKPVART
ncbi:MAG: ester cyclase [Nitrososphaeraceae archaeon]